MKRPRVRENVRRWQERLERSSHDLWLLGGLSFLETTVLPIPIEVILIPFMAANRHRIWRLAAATLAGCVLGALAGYAVGMLFFESVGRWLVETLGWQQAYAGFQEFFDRHGFLAIVQVGILPIPFQVAMLTAGLSGYPILLFVLATTVARGVRYFGLAWLVKRFGSRAKDLWERHSVLVTIGAALVIGLLVWLGDLAAQRIMA